MTALRLSVWATVDLPGLHHWPDAPPHRAYLGAPHRHLFHIRAEVRAAHTDRHVEFHDLQELMRRWWKVRGEDRGTQSCEELAVELAAHLEQEGLTVLRVDVAEDRENGAAIQLRDCACTS